MKNTLIVGVIVVVVLVGGFVYLGMNQQANAPTGANTGSGAPVNGTQNQQNGVAAVGRVVFGVKDAAASLENIDSVLITVTEVRVHSVIKGWITVTEESKQFDLLKLKSSDALALLADANLETGTYDQVRLSVKNIIVVGKDGKTHTAKLPSGDLKIMGKFLVKDGKTSSVVVDFLLDQSLHLTGNGSYIFAPVMKFEGRSSATVKIAGGLIDLKDGDIDGDVTVGMNENGDIGVGIKIDASASLDIIGDVIRVKAKGETDAGVKITASSAIDIARKNGYIDLPISVKMVTDNDIKAWLVVGTKGVEVVTVRVDVVSGAVTNAQ